MRIKEAQPSDLEFLYDMLYEAVYWRAIAAGHPPSRQEGLADPEVSKTLADWGDRDGDVAVVAQEDPGPVGAAWYRFWTDDNHVRGYLDVATPAVIIAVDHNHRGQGVGRRLLDGLTDRAASDGIRQLSLMVSKDNPAVGLYRTCGFVTHRDTGDSWLMVRNLIDTP